MIAAGTKAVELTRVSVYICVWHFVGLGHQAVGVDHVVVGLKTEVVMSGIFCPGC